MRPYLPWFRKLAREVKLSPTMLEALDRIDWAGEPVWYHDVGSGARTTEALLRRKLVTESRQWPSGAVRCGTPGHRHVGYVKLTAKGRKILETYRVRP